MIDRPGLIRVAGVGMGLSDQAPGVPGSHHVETPIGFEFVHRQLVLAQLTEHQPQIAVIVALGGIALHGGHEGIAGR